MKKILCFIDAFSLGGAERQLIGLAMFLKQKGYDVTLLAYHQENFYEGLLQSNKLHYEILQTGESQWSKVKAVRRYIKQQNGFDWVIAYKNGPCIIACILKLLGLKSKVLVSERNTTQILTKRERTKYFLYRFADYIVPNSYSQAKFISVHVPSLKQKIVTITNFTDTEHFATVNKKQMPVLKAMTAGRIAKQKNILKFLEAISIVSKNGIKDILFEWYGDVQPGEESYGEQVLSEVQDLGLDDIISFYPATKDIVKKYQECDVFCLPSIYEGFPNVICEAMSCGKPIVCSNVCDNPQIVENGKNGFLFNPNDVKDIAKCITRIYKMSQDMRNKMGKVSRTIAEQKFSEQAFVEKYITLIES